MRRAFLLNFFFFIALLCSGQDSIKNTSFCDYGSQANPSFKKGINYFIDNCGFLNTHQFCYDDLIKVNYDVNDEEECIEEPDGERVFAQLNYFDPKRDSLHFLHLYYPDGRLNGSWWLPRPIIVMVPPANIKPIRHRRLAAYFASLGYIVAVPSYDSPILGFDKLDNDLRLYKDIQQIRAAVRFLRAYFETQNQNPYRKTTADINTYMLYGISYGGTVSLNYTLFDMEDINPLINTDNDTMGGCVGGLDDVGSASAQYYIEPSASVAFTAMVSDLDIIDQEDTIPLMLLHGTCDPKVPFDSSTYSRLFGGDSSLDSLGFLCDVSKDFTTNDPDSVMYGTNRIIAHLYGTYWYYRFCGVDHSLGIYDVYNNRNVKYFFSNITRKRRLSTKVITINHTGLINPNTGLPAGFRPGCNCETISGTYEPYFCFPSPEGPYEIEDGIILNEEMISDIPECLKIVCNERSYTAIETPTIRILISPNPGDCRGSIIYESEEDETLLVELFKIDGRLVNRYKHQFYKGTNVLKICPDQMLNDGLYILRIGHDSAKFYIKTPL